MTLFFLESFIKSTHKYHLDTKAILHISNFAILLIAMQYWNYMKVLDLCTYVCFDIPDLYNITCMQLDTRTVHTMCNAFKTGILNLTFLIVCHDDVIFDLYLLEKMSVHNRACTTKFIFELTGLLRYYRYSKCPKLACRIQ